MSLKCCCMILRSKLYAWTTSKCGADIYMAGNSAGNSSIPHSLVIVIRCVSCLHSLYSQVRTWGNSYSAWRVYIPYIALNPGYSCIMECLGTRLYVIHSHAHQKNMFVGDTIVDNNHFQLPEFTAIIGTRSLVSRHTIVCSYYVVKWMLANHHSMTNNCNEVW